MVNHEEDLARSMLSGRRQSGTQYFTKVHRALCKGQITQERQGRPAVDTGRVGKEGCSKLELFRNARIVLYFDCSHSNRGGHMP